MITVTQQEFNKQYRAGAPGPTGKQLRKCTGRHSGPRNPDSSRRVKETLYITTMCLQAQPTDRPLQNQRKTHCTFKGPQTVKQYSTFLQLIFQPSTPFPRVREVGGTESEGRMLMGNQQLHPRALLIPGCDLGQFVFLCFLTSKIR